MGCLCAPLTAAGAGAMQHAVDRLAAPKGPAYVQVTGAEFASYLVRDHPPGWVQAAVIDDKLHVRIRSTPIEVFGTIDMPRPGVGEFHAITVSLPAAVSDIRVAHGLITLYKKIP